MKLEDGVKINYAFLDETSIGCLTFFFCLLTLIIIWQVISVATQFQTPNVRRGTIL